MQKTAIFDGKKEKNNALEARRRKISLGVMIILILFSVSFLSARDSLGTFKKGSCMELIQTCSSCSYNNISKVSYPDSSEALAGVGMVKSGNYYNYSFCDTTQIGTYLVAGYGDKDGVKSDWVYDFEITGTGFGFDTGKSILYLGLLGLLLVLFVIDIIAIPKLPSKDNYDEEGTLISINQMKYVRPVLWVVAYLLIMAVMFIGSNVALAYMGETLIGNVLFRISQIMLGLMLPGLVFWFIYIFYNIFQDKEMKKYIERGVIDEWPKG